MYRGSFGNALQQHVKIWSDRVMYLSELGIFVLESAEPPSIILCNCIFEASICVRESPLGVTADDIREMIKYQIDPITGVPEMRTLVEKSRPFINQQISIRIDMSIETQHQMSMTVRMWDIPAFVAVRQIHPKVFQDLELTMTRHYMVLSSVIGSDVAMLIVRRMLDVTLANTEQMPNLISPSIDQNQSRWMEEDPWCNII